MTWTNPLLKFDWNPESGTQLIHCFNTQTLPRNKQVQVNVWSFAQDVWSK